MLLEPAGCPGLDKPSHPELAAPGADVLAVMLPACTEL
jgi:hypothetical protein